VADERAARGCNAGSSLDRTMADNGIASDFCMPISRPALYRRQCANNYAKRRPFIRPFGRIQTGLSVSIIVAARGANNRPDARPASTFSVACRYRWRICRFADRSPNESRILERIARPSLPRNS